MRSWTDFARKQVIGIVGLATGVGWEGLVIPAYVRLHLTTYLGNFLTRPEAGWFPLTLMFVGFIPVICSFVLFSLPLVSNVDLQWSFMVKRRTMGAITILSSSLLWLLFLWSLVMAE